MINTIQMVNAWFSQAMRGFAGYTNASDHEFFFDDDVDFEAQFGEGADLREYFLEFLSGKRFRLFQVISATQVELFDPALELNLTGERWWIRHMDDPPDHLWAEISYLDNRPTIESNFGRLIGFTLDDLSERTDNLDYLSAVQGLWSYVWEGRTVFKTRVSSQIILGLPFAEERGNIVSIESPFDSTRDRILIQSLENPADVKSYPYPSEFAIETNPATGVAYVLGDTVEQFAPLCEGVTITDYIKEPDWFRTYVNSGDFYEPQKVHTFGVIVDAEVFDLVNLLFLIQYLRQYKPTYKDPFFVVLRSLANSVSVGDSVVTGPAVPSSGYTYPVEWPSYEVPLGWSTSPHEVPRDASPVVPENLGIQFGGLRLADVPGKMPDGWEGQGPWPVPIYGNHVPTISEGSFRFDDTDESGAYIHRYDEHLLAENISLDGTMEQAGLGSGRVLVGSPATAGKSSTEFLYGTQSLHIADTVAGVGVKQFISGTTPDAGFQIGASFWIYLVSGQAHILLYDQDNPQTVIAEWRHATHQLEWHQIRLHAWEVSESTGNVINLQFLTGPAGGDFYIDAAGPDDWQQVGIFEKAMPWVQWGYDRTIIGRTGGYTRGGLPDEDLTFQISIMVP